MKMQYSYDLCPHPVHHNTLLSIMYLSAIQILICHRGIKIIGSTSFGFAQKTIHDLQKYCIELIVALSLTNATKKAIPQNLIL